MILPVIDTSKCTASGMCEAIAPEVFELGIASHPRILTGADQSVEEQEALRNAAACCPADAITIESKS